MATILAVVFGITTIVFGIKWFLMKAAFGTLSKWMMEKSNMFPTDEDLDEIGNKVIREMFQSKP